MVFCSCTFQRIYEMFYFIEIYSLYCHADDKSMSNASAKIEDIVLNLKHDTKIATTLFTDNGMEPCPDKFRQMVMSSNDIDTHSLGQNDATRLRSHELCYIVLLRVKMDNDDEAC